MKNCKKLIALCLALATIFSFTVFASAAGTDISASGDSASAAVNLSSTVDGSLDGDPAPTAMSVTVPTVLPIAVGTDGTVTTATDAKIVNNSYGAVRVASVTWKPPAAGVSPPSATSPLWPARRWTATSWASPSPWATALPRTPSPAAPPASSSFPLLRPAAICPAWVTLPGTPSPSSTTPS